MNVLEIKNLSKSFDDKKIIDNVSFSIGQAKLVGLLGKNGSGKTTIIKLINDLLTIDQGDVKICGEKVGVKSKALVSFLPERTYLDTSNSVKQVLDFFESFYTDFDRKKAVKLLTDLDLDENAKLSKMSKGMKEKVQLVLVMSRNAKLYVLDEPLGGVDPSTREIILDTILTNLSEGSSMLITTHLISDVERILDEVVIIDKGTVVLKGDADEIRQKENCSIDQLFRRLV